jgi:hypothetical protein
MAHSSSPALHANDWITLAENTELDCVHDSPLQTAVNILLPWLCLEVGLRLGEVEWVNAAVQVRVLLKLVKGVPVHPKKERKHTLAAMSLRVTMMMGQTGRYLETRRAVVPLMHVRITHVQRVGRLTSWSGPRWRQRSARDWH